MRDDFCVFILSHNRSDRVYTLRTLETHGFSGKVYIVIDDEDPAADEYKKRFGSKVIQFSKSEAAEYTDQGDNASERRSVVFARNACFELAQEVGCRFFLELDDDYSGFYYRFDKKRHYGSFKLEPLDWFFGRVFDYLSKTPFAAIAISQGGDHIGGGFAKHEIGTKRKAMNAFFCDTQKPFRFFGKFNDDVNTYTTLQRAGLPFLTIMAAQVNQKATQTNAGGLTDIYLESGTYVKSFYSVMYSPSCVKVSTIRDPRQYGGYERIHHVVDWNATAPKILSEKFRKVRGNG